MSEIRNVTVVGAGTMGNGIAQVFALHEHPVTMVDVAEEFVERGMATIQGSLERMLKKGKLSSEDLAGVMERIKPTTRLLDAADADLVVEAAPEDFAIKQ